MMIDTIKYKQHIYDVVGAIHEVHKELGAGLNEYCYQAQLFNYMRLLQCPCGILVNFAPQFAEIERYFLDKEKNSIIGTDGKVKQ